MDERKYYKIYTQLADAIAEYSLPISELNLNTMVTAMLIMIDNNYQPVDVSMYRLYRELADHYDVTPKCVESRLRRFQTAFLFNIPQNLAINIFTFRYPLISNGEFMKVFSQHIATWC